MDNNRITLDSAMETLRSMFPNDSDEYLKGMLYKTKGHMERCIEMLLQEQDLGTKTDFEQRKSKGSGLSEADFKHNLSSEFLRLTSTGPSSHLTQEQADLLLAQQLQRQFYQEAQRENRKQHKRSHHHEHGRHEPVVKSRIGSLPIESQKETGAGQKLKAKLENLSENAKKKLGDFFKKLKPNSNNQEYSSLLGATDEDNAVDFHNQL